VRVYDEEVYKNMNGSVRKDARRADAGRWSRKEKLRTPPLMTKSDHSHSPVSLRVSSWDIPTGTPAYGCN
jgi:hypothetical protein